MLAAMTELLATHSKNKSLKFYYSRQLGNRQDIAEILLKATLNTIALTLIISVLFDIIEKH
jgi:hypothetical protein